MRARGEEKCLYGASLFPPCGGRDSRERAEVSARKSGAHYLTEKQPFPFFFLMQLSSFATLTTRAVLTIFQSKTTIFFPLPLFSRMSTQHTVYTNRKGEKKNAKRTFTAQVSPTEKQPCNKVKLFRLWTQCYSVFTSQS